jgi:WD40 repeat protein
MIRKAYFSVATMVLALIHGADAGDKAPEPLTLKKHAKPVMGLAFSPDGKSIATSDEDGVILLWDVATWKPRAEMSMKAKFIRCVAWSGDSKLLITGDKAKNAQLWDAETGKAIGEPFNQIRAVWAVAISKDGKRVATAGNGSPVRLWDVESRKLLGTYEAHEGFVNSLAFSSDGKHLLTAGGLAVVRIYHLDKIEGEGHVAMKGSKAAFSADGKVLAGVHLSKITFAEGGKVLVSTHFTTTVRDMATGTDRCTFEAVMKGSGNGNFTSIAVNADGSVIAVSTDQMVHLFDGQTGKRLADLGIHPPSVSALSFSPDGKKLASAGGTTIRVWDVPGK